MFDLFQNKLFILLGVGVVGVGLLLRKSAQTGTASEEGSTGEISPTYANARLYIPTNEYYIDYTEGNKTVTTDNSTGSTPTPSINQPKENNVTSTVPKKTSNSVTMINGKELDLDNQKKYLQNVAKQNKHAKLWAEKQAASYGITNLWADTGTLDIDNQIKYLSSLKAKGGGEASWAVKQATIYGLKI